MARLKGRDDLVNVEGRLGRAFRNATLTALQTAFLSAASGADKTAATQALAEFHRAARKLHISENAFRARPAADKPSLLTYLRSPEQFTAMRDFRIAKQKLLRFSPEISLSIVRLTAQETETAPRRTRSPDPATL